MFEPATISLVAGVAALLAGATRLVLRTLQLHKEDKVEKVIEVMDLKRNPATEEPLVPSWGKYAVRIGDELVTVRNSEEFTALIQKILRDKLKNEGRL
jgi:hypothetical protein